MKYDNLMAHYGTAKNASNEIGVRTQTIYLWKSDGFIPFSRQCIIEVLTGGTLIADKEHGAPLKAHNS